MTARIASTTKHMSDVRQVIALASVCLLLAGITGAGLAQQGDWVPQDATEFSTHLHNLNTMAAEQVSIQAAASSASQEFTTQLDTLRTAAFAAKGESDALMIVQDVNDHVSQLQVLRQMESTILMASTGD